MIYDYYLSLKEKADEEFDIISFEEWENINQKRLNGKPEEEKYIIWQQEEIVGKRKRYMRLQKIKDFYKNFYPSLDDLHILPKNSILIEIPFALEKPYTSKDEGEFNVIDGRGFENPIVRDKLLGCAIVRPSSWKGHLRFAARMVNWNGGDDEKKRIIERLFGSEKEKEPHKKGRLHFFPTFFEDEAKRDVITPLDRKTRTPVQGRSPVTLEIMDRRATGEFFILYLPYPKGADFKEKEIKRDLKFLVEALKLMFLTYGFSAKKTSGFGVVEPEFPKEGEFKIVGVSEEELPNKGRFKSFDKLQEIIDNVSKHLEDEDGK